MRRINSRTQLSEKDLHCIARMLQSALFADNIFYGCNFCNYKNECFTGNIFDMNDTNVRKKLQEITGVDLGPQFNRNNPETKFEELIAIKKELQDIKGIMESNFATIPDENQIAKLVSKMNLTRYF